MLVLYYLWNAVRHRTAKRCEVAPLKGCWNCGDGSTLARQIHHAVHEVINSTFPPFLVSGGGPEQTVPLPLCRRLGGLSARSLAWWGSLGRCHADLPQLDKHIKGPESNRGLLSVTAQQACFGFLSLISVARQAPWYVLHIARGEQFILLDFQLFYLSRKQSTVPCCAQAFNFAMLFKYNCIITFV